MIPQWMLPGLEIMRLSNNRLTGRIPSNFIFNTTSLQGFNVALHNNDLSGLARQ